MIGSRSIKMNNNEDLEKLQSSRVDNGQSLLLQGQREQDLQLLIRAHEKIRTLQQENTRLLDEQQSLKQELQNQKEKSKRMCDENKKLRYEMDELMKRIARCEKKFDFSQYELVTEGSSETINLNNVNNLNNYDNNPNSDDNNNQVVGDTECKVSSDIEGLENDNFRFNHTGKSAQKQNDRLLQSSQSTPLIQNFNCEIVSKEQRLQFLSSCKQEFAQQLEKINERVNSSHRGIMSRKGSESLGLEIQTNPKVQGYAGVKNFLKEAERQFQVQTSKTLTNNLYIDRNSRISSGSLIRRDLGRNEFSKDKLGDRTNYVNSKYASVNKNITNNFDRTSYLTKSPTLKTNLRHQSAHEHNTPYRDARQYQQMTQQINRESLLKKCNTSKNLYINSGDYSKYTYCSKDKRAEVKDRKRKEIDMELRDNHGFIKYRGLCL